ncbi:MAG: A/G-specific adenine glycosylase [Candidatus Marinimicrobia bacterium]|nr:A/G-specific adenine glycosylase [Candidatus Neomarinimicrobiota bacterium]|tara:strand:- start:13932 stop:14996 length:1065 start_codon:yes stop_codon:yes gene_type:complete
MQFNSITQKLHDWYGENKRLLPFRDTEDPYKIWLSEVMLQQTQVNTVLPYYNKWIKRFPTISSVANEKLDTVLKYWEGLGYYKRCINFYKAIRIIKDDFHCKIPNNRKNFILLPGVGEYTASAVLSIAFKKPYPVLDVNVKRVMSRMLGIKNLTRHNEKRIMVHLNKMIFKDNPGDFNQAMMDLGSLLCKSSNPLCSKCPLRTNCYAYRNNKSDKYPNKIKTKTLPHYDISIGIIWRENKFYIQKRNLKSMLGGLWEFPGGKIKPGESAKVALKREIREECGVSIKNINKIGIVKHSYSHFKITLYCFYCREKKDSLELNNNAKMITINEIKNFPFPKANHKIFELFKQSQFYV